ncbi:MAG: hypothetical protein MUC49_19370 [Raineya sp.]|jgi:hypothetical protein|nr:hypothetical protein [Raineya sp.]
METDKIIKIVIAVVIGIGLAFFLGKILKFLFWLVLAGVGAYLAYEVLFNKKQVK